MPCRLRPGVWRGAESSAMHKAKKVPGWSSAAAPAGIVVELGAAGVLEEKRAGESEARMRIATRSSSSTNGSPCNWDAHSVSAAADFE